VSFPTRHSDEQRPRRHPRRRLVPVRPGSIVGRGVYRADGGRGIRADSGFGITFVELTYLIEKGKLAQAVLAELWTVVQDPSEPVDALPLALDVAKVFGQIPRGSVPDMPDRITAATALAHGLPLVSAAQKIRSLSVAGLSIVW